MRQRKLGRPTPARAFLALAGCTTLLAPTAALAQAAQSQASRISVSWTEAPIGDVLQAFAAFSGASIVAGTGVSGFVSADINDQPWDVALEAILSTRGLVATEDEYGIVRIENMADLDAREAVEPILTRSYRISFSRAGEIQAAVAPLLSARGSASVVESTNTLVVSDIARVQRAIASLLR
jgi:type II secretory pathway component HofQ